MDKFDFMCLIDDIFDTCKTKEEMDSIRNQMIEIIQKKYELKIGFKTTMEEFK